MSNDDGEREAARRLRQYLLFVQQQLLEQQDLDDDAEYEFVIEEDVDFDDDDEDYDENEEDMSQDEGMPEEEMKVEEETDSKRQAKELLDHPFSHEVMLDTRCKPNKPDENVIQMIQYREIGQANSFSRKHKTHINQRFLPSKSAILDAYDNQVFCGKFSSDGKYFMSACQDRRIRLYSTFSWEKIREVIARDIGWSIISTDYSPDQRWFIYSSWSNYIHICNLVGEHEIHDSLDLQPTTQRFCLFSVQFSPDSNEILCGSSDRNIYIYDLTRKEVAHKVKAHGDDVNTACYAENDNTNVIFSGSDDSLCKVWDKRLLGSQKEAVGVLVGHLEGITHIASKGDGRYFISNGKDQCIKLWDIRKMQNYNGGAKKRNMGWDYRYGEVRAHRAAFTGKTSHPNDMSIMTYRGHKVFQTLIRAGFSPAETTGQKYIYSGSYDGTAHIYDTLTGDVVTKLKGHTATVRDIHWHPTENMIATSSWDGTVVIWD